MSKVNSIPLGSLPAVFNRCGFSTDEMVAILNMMMSYWAHNDESADITAEFIRSELDAEAYIVQTMISEGLPELANIASLVRQAFLTGRLIRWNVFSYIILLEFENDD